VRLDLHCHSTCSDGSLNPTELAKRALARGVELFSLTDHDTTAGSAEVVAALGEGVRVLRGVELSCHEHGKTVHLLMFDVAADERWCLVEDKLTEMKAQRRTRIFEMAALLEQRGLPIDADAIIERAGGNSVGRPHIARALVAAGWLTSTSEAFDRYLYDGGPADVPIKRLSVGDGVELGRSAGARMSIAHPHTLGQIVANKLYDSYRDSGLDGIEAYYGMYSSAQRKHWLECARRHDLTVTAGSDFHGDMVRKVKEPVIDVPEYVSDRLIDWLG